jgi:hypothetical protein
MLIELMAADAAAVAQARESGGELEGCKQLQQICKEEGL